jgi:hypothetical protein
LGGWRSTYMRPRGIGPRRPFTICSYIRSSAATGLTKTKKRQEKTATQQRPERRGGGFLLPPNCPGHQAIRDKGQAKFFASSFDAPPRASVQGGYRPLQRPNASLPEALHLFLIRKSGAQGSQCGTVKQPISKLLQRPGCASTCRALPRIVPFVPRARPSFIFRQHPCDPVMRGLRSPRPVTLTVNFCQSLLSWS